MAPLLVAVLLLTIVLQYQNAMLPTRHNNPSRHSTQIWGRPFMCYPLMLKQIGSHNLRSDQIEKNHFPLLKLQSAIFLLSKYIILSHKYPVEEMSSVAPYNTVLNVCFQIKAMVNNFQPF